MNDSREGVTEFCQCYSGSFTIAKTCGSNAYTRAASPNHSVTSSIRIAKALFREVKPEMPLSRGGTQILT